MGHPGAVRIYTSGNPKPNPGDADFFAVVEHNTAEHIRLAAQRVKGWIDAVDDDTEDEEADDDEDDDDEDGADSDDDGLTPPVLLQVTAQHARKHTPAVS